jgi:Putative MetA-pathway of phenol degradation
VNTCTRTERRRRRRVRPEPTARAAGKLARNENGPTRIPPAAGTPAGRAGRRGLVALALLLLSASAAWAGRPLDTEDTGTVDPGKAQLEASGNFARSAPVDAWIGLAKLAIGVVPRLEASAQAAFVALDVPGARGEAGLGDTIVRVKYRLLDETLTLPALLAAAELRLPTGDDRRGLGLDDVDVLALAVVSKTLGPATVFGNGGYRFVLRDRDLDAWVLSAAIEYRAITAVALVGEVVSELATTRVRDELVLLRAGVVYGLTDRIKVDGAIGFGLTRASPDVTVTVGITIALF